MFRRLTLLALPALAIVACDVADAGPTRTRESAFSYSSQLAPGATVHVRTARGDIQVEPASDDSLRVVGDLEWRGLAASDMERTESISRDERDGALPPPPPLPPPRSSGVSTAAASTAPSTRPPRRGRAPSPGSSSGS